MSLSTHKISKNTHNVGGVPTRCQPTSDWGLSRIHLKILLIEGRLIETPQGSEGAAIELSECEEMNSDSRISRLEGNISRLEEKVDLILHSILRNERPPWFESAHQSLLTEFASLRKEATHVFDRATGVAEENHHLRKEISELAEGADTFLASLQQKLSKKERELFFGCIATKEENGRRRLLTYSEIGKQFGITKQAIEKRLRALTIRNPSVAQYIKAVRNPPQTTSFSAISPSDRRKHGIDEAYNYDER